MEHICLPIDEAKRAVIKDIIRLDTITNEIKSNEDSISLNKIFTKRNKKLSNMSDLELNSNQNELDKRKLDELESMKNNNCK